MGLLEAILNRIAGKKYKRKWGTYKIAYNHFMHTLMSCMNPNTHTHAHITLKEKG